MADRAAWIAERAKAKHPDVPVLKFGVQELSFTAEFDAAICVDAMENVFPEHWPAVLESLKRAVTPGGPLYLTVELPEDDLAETYAAALAEGLPVVTGEYVKDGGYHYYPDPSQVSNWISAAGLLVADAVTSDGYCHYLLSTPRSPGSPQSRETAGASATEPRRRVGAGARNRAAAWHENVPAG